MSADREEIRESASAMAVAWMEIARSATDIAHARRTMYLAYMSEGFTPEEALELVKTP